MKPFYQDHLLTVYQADVMDGLRELPDGSVHCCVTSPPYWGLRDYGVDGQIGLEKTPEEYVAKMVAVFREVKRVLRDDGVLFLNLGDSYCGDGRGWEYCDPNGKQLTNRGTVGVKASEIPNGLKPKDLVGIPWRVAFALQADGWYLRSDIIWHKPNPMPESVTDRPTKAHEYIFLLSKQSRYYYDAEAVKETAVHEPEIRDRNGEGYNPSMGDGRDRFSPGKRAYGFEGTRNKRTVWTVPEDEWQQFLEWKRLHSRDKKDVWTVPSQPYPESHFATFPEALIKPCILAGTSAKGCCPHCGAPWERVVESSPMEIDRSDRTHDLGRTRSSGTMTKPAESKTVGWQPTCQHGEDASEVRSPIPCTVLDPFGGSFTTAQVSLELGRKSVIIEINPKYVKLGMERTHITPSLPLA